MSLHRHPHTWCSESQPCLIKFQPLCSSLSLVLRSPVKGSVASLRRWGADRPSRQGRRGLCRWRGVPVLMLREGAGLNPRGGCGGLARLPEGLWPIVSSPVCM